MHFLLATFRNATYFCCILALGYTIYGVTQKNRDLVKDSLKFLCFVAVAAIIATCLFRSFA